MTLSTSIPSSALLNQDQNIKIQEQRNLTPALPLLLNKKQLALLTGLSEKRAIEILIQHGVQPIDFGRGRGNGLRWRTTAVIEVLDILHNEAQAKKQKIRIASRRFSVRGKTAAQLFAEFNGNIHTHAEVCDGN